MLNIFMNVAEQSFYLSVECLSVLLFPDSNGDISTSAAMVPKVVLQMHQWFTSSATLVEQMMALHKRAGEISPCTIEGCAHGHSSTSPEVCQLLQYQTRVCHAIR